MLYAVKRHIDTLGLVHSKTDRSAAGWGVATLPSGKALGTRHMDVRVPPTPSVH